MTQRNERARAQQAIYYVAVRHLASVSVNGGFVTRTPAIEPVGPNITKGQVLLNRVPDGPFSELRLGK